MNSGGETVDEPVIYGAFIKVCTMTGGYKNIKWASHPMPAPVLRNVRAQLARALAQVDALLQDAA